MGPGLRGNWGDLGGDLGRLRWARCAYKKEEKREKEGKRGGGLKKMQKQKVKKKGCRDIWVPACFNIVVNTRGLNILEAVF